MVVSRYELKRKLLSPHTAYKRHRSRDLDAYARALLEAQYYRPTMYRFMAATGREPDFLAEADIDETSVVLDVGAYQGEWSERIASRYGSRIHAFEPNPIALTRMRSALADHDNVIVHDYGLGASDDDVHLALDGPGSTVFRTTGAFGSAGVHIRDVVAVLDELHIDDVDLCKVNIEGGEYDLFERLIASDRLRHVRLVSVQFHEWHPGAYRRRRAIRKALRRTHDLQWDFPFVWEFWSRRG